ncbi:LAMI_0H14048g1_1 [Lachancea mirantina]|uniref:LAMI_0H14048g1_1 n=1 Tax=Lachancea mirantina TaxID=1230905 RepID=A0A1G4KI93_9SACH|nr:LAMI_0H14048g1_1 [Lachancea mirantina]
MFKQLSQLGKNLSDELAKGLSEDLNDGQDQFDSNSDLPRDIQVKLRKFEKYEQKYPLLLAAYKNEKVKNEKLLSIQKVLSENTPVSSLEDLHSLQGFFENLETKTTMLNDEIKRLSLDNNEKSQKVATYEAEIQELRQDNELLKKDQASETTKVDEDLVSENLEIKKQLEQSESELAETREKLRSEESEKTNLDTRLGEALSEIEKWKAQLEKGRALQAPPNNQDSEDAKNVAHTQASSHSKKKKKKGKKKNSVPAKEPVPDQSKDFADGEDDIANLSPADNSNKNVEQDNTDKSETSSASRDLDDSLRSLTEENFILKEDLQKVRELLKSKSEELEHMNDIVRSVGNELVEAKDELKGTKNGKSEELKALQDKIEELTKEKENHSKRSSEIKIEAENLRKELEKVTQTLSNKEQQASSALDQFAKQKREFENKYAQLNDELNKTKQSNKTLGDQMTEYSNLKRNSSSLRLSLDQKMKTVTYLEQQVKEYSAKEEQAKLRFKEVKVEAERLGKQMKELKAENETLKANLSKKESSLESFIKENGKLSERYDVLSEKYEMLQNMKSNSSDQVEAYRKRYEELNLKLKEALRSLSSVEDELNENTSLLQERTREATAMRRLLSQNQRDLEEKSKQLEEKEKIANEERSQLQSEIAVKTARLNNEMGSLTEINARLKDEVHLLQERIKLLEEEEKRVKAANLKMKDIADEHNKTSNEVSFTLNSLREDFLKAEKKIRKLEVTKEELRELNLDLEKKLEKVTKNYKSLSSQLTSAREKGAANSLSRSNSVISMPSRSNSVVNLGNGAQNSDFSPSHGGRSNFEFNEKIAYIKNVLIGFLEHREQRDQLLPVISTLLQLDSNDERRLLVSLK